MKKIKSTLIVFSLFIFFFHSHGCKKNNTVYKPVSNEVLLLHLTELRTRVEQFDLGTMTPIDAAFSTFICGRYDKDEDPLVKEIEVSDTMIVNSVIKTVNYGDIYISLHGTNNYAPSGLYDGTLTNPDYYDNDMEQRFYMTDHQVDRVLDFLKNKTE